MVTKIKMGSEEEKDITRALVGAVWEEAKEAESQGMTIAEFHEDYYKRHVGGEIWARFRFILLEAGLYEQ